jgi:DNA-binding CsgD family transcriptional regulator
VEGCEQEAEDLADVGRLQPAADVCGRPFEVGQLRPVAHRKEHERSQIELRGRDESIGGNRAAADERRRWREDFVEACMFRRAQAEIPVSLRINDKLFEYRTWLEPAGDDLVVCRLVRCFGQVLTEQERAVLALVAGGASNMEIARALGIQSATVRSHIASMRRKLNVRRPEGLLLAALQMDGNGVQERTAPTPSLR